MLRTIEESDENKPGVIPDYAKSGNGIGREVLEVLDGQQVNGKSTLCGTRGGWLNPLLGEAKYYPGADSTS